MNFDMSTFIADRRGTTAMIFGLTIIPFALMTGMVVDLSRLSMTRSALQQTTDAVSLAVAAQLNGLSSLSAVKERATVLLQSTSRLSTATVVDASLSSDKRMFCLTAQVDIPTTVLKIAHVDVMSPRTTACAQFGGGAQSYEIALALDNSGSMSQSSGGLSKMQSLQTAATNFVNTLFTRAPGKVKIAIAPFSGLVIPVDPANRSLPWIDAYGQSSQHWITFGDKASANAAGYTSRFGVFDSLKAAKASWDFGGCYEPQPYPLNVSETVPTAANPDTLFVPYLAPDEPDSGYGNDYLSDSGGACATAPSGAWNGLTRPCKYKLSGTASGGGARGPNGLCPSAATQTLLQLTSNQTTLTSKIKQLAAGGDTNLHEGFMWAWRAISPNAPFNAGSAYRTTNVNKILVLMTDGFNNWSSDANTVGGSQYAAPGYYSYNGQKNIRLPDGSRGNGVDYQSALKNAANSGTDYKPTSREAQDELTREACENAKAAGVEIYTIGFSVSTAPIDAAGMDLLKKCASNADHYFLATTGGELDSAFSKLAGNLQKLRLSQ